MRPNSQHDSEGSGNASATLDGQNHERYELALSLLEAGSTDQACQTVRSLGDVIPAASRAAIFQNFAERLLKNGKVGHAADFVADEAELLEREGKPEQASTVLYNFAEALFDAGLYGWSGSRYYSAAMVYVAVGNLERALSVLNEADTRFSSIQQEPFTGWLKSHIAVLSGVGSPVDRVRQLQRDFEHYQRNNWVRSCTEGIGKLSENKH